MIAVCEGLESLNQWDTGHSFILLARTTSDRGPDFFTPLSLFASMRQDLEVSQIEVLLFV